MIDNGGLEDDEIEAMLAEDRESDMELHYSVLATQFGAYFLAEVERRAGASREGMLEQMNGMRGTARTQAIYWLRRILEGKP